MLKLLFEKLNSTILKGIIREGESMKDSEKKWLYNEEREWLINGPKISIKEGLECRGEGKLLSKWDEFQITFKEDIVTDTDGKLWAILAETDEGLKLIGRKSRKEIELTPEKKSFFYSRPGVYIVKQSKTSEIYGKQRTHYIGEGKNLAQRLRNRSDRREEIFHGGSEVTIIIKCEGKIEEDQFFMHEVRLTCERMISDLIEEKWQGAECCNKPSWCFIHEAGVTQVGEVELFVRRLLEDGKISDP